MSFLTGHTNTKDNVNAPTADMFRNLVSWISGQGFGGLMPGTNVNPADAAPYQKLFADQNAQTFGQAKESAGNLTGSGLGSQLANAGQKASTEQGSFLANLFENRRQQDAARFLQLILGVGNNNAVGTHETYTPGFLDYAMEGAQTAASFFGGGTPTPANQRGDTYAGTPAGPANEFGGASVYNFPNSVQPYRTTEGYGNPLSGYQSPLLKNPRDSFGNS